jgi:GNAT superfamily N-acetyltransferase
MQVREMKREDRGPVLDLLEHAFGLRELFERYMDFDPAFAYGDYLLALDGDAPVACLQIFDKTIRLRGEAVRLGGIGSVATRASHRGRGLSSDLLERALERMRGRKMWLSLLFAAPVAPLYERLGWHRVPAPLLRLTPAKRSSTPPPQSGRAFRPEDLWQVNELYRAYSGALSGPTLRDASYWRGQLHTAGTPEEDFRVAARDGAIVAYARVASFNGRLRALEYGRDARGAEALAELLASHAYGPHALHAPFVRDPEVGGALERRGIELSLARDPSPMWRVLERLPLARLAGVPDSCPDSELLATLVGDGAATYWPSDRF